MSLHDLLSDEDIEKFKALREILEDLLDTIDIITDEKALKKLEEALVDVKKGNIVKWESIKKV